MTNVVPCILVTLSITHWDPNVRDRKVSEDVAERHNVTDSRMCRLRKTLVPKNDALRQVFSVMREARLYHYANTHAWMFDGPRFMAADAFSEYKAKMEEFKDRFEKAVLEFLNQYDELKDRAREVLGTLYNEADYPSREQVGSRFTFTYSVQPMPEASQFNGLGFNAEAVEELRKSLEADMRATFEKANRRLWQELYEKLEKLTSKLQDEKASVRQGTLDAVRNMATMLPKLNVTQDTRLEVLSSRLLRNLEGVTEETVANDNRARRRLAQETGTVFTVMQSFMNRRKAPAEAEVPLEKSYA